MAEAVDYSKLEDVSKDVARESFLREEDEGIVWNRTATDRLLREEWNFKNPEDEKEFERSKEKNHLDRPFHEKEYKQKFFRDEIEKKKVVKKTIAGERGTGYFVNRADGPQSAEFLKRLDVDRDMDGKVNGLKYRTKGGQTERKIVINKYGNFYFSSNKSVYFRNAIEDFKNMYDLAVDEHIKSRLYKVENILPCWS